MNRFLLILLSLACVAVSAVAQVPRQFSVSAQFVRADGTTPPDGDVDITVSLYTAADATEPVWTATLPSSFRYGVADILLGGDGQPALPDMFTSYWVGVRTATDEFQPRIRISPVPQALVAAQSADASPVGTIVAYAGMEDGLPEGWMVCDGRSLQRTSFAILFSRLGTRWGGTPDGEDFRIPDLRGSMLRGGPASGGIMDGPTMTYDEGRYAARYYSPNSPPVSGLGGPAVADILYIIRVR